MWCVGHIALADGQMVGMLEARDNPLAEWQSMFSAKTPPTDNADNYPPYDQVLAAWREMRRTIRAALDTLAEADLDKPNPHAPEGFEAFFGTFGKTLASVSLHTMHHRGQLADIRRSLSREPIMA